jgi:hypothetical protein
MLGNKPSAGGPIQSSSDLIARAIDDNADWVSRILKGVKPFQYIPAQYLASSPSQLTIIQPSTKITKRDFEGFLSKELLRKAIMETFCSTCETHERRKSLRELARKPMSVALLFNRSARDRFVAYSERELSNRPPLKGDKWNLRLSFEDPMTIFNPSDSFIILQ